jgi:alpha-glucosidase
LIPRPKPDDTYEDIDLEFDCTDHLILMQTLPQKPNNVIGDDEPSFWFSVTRHSTGDVIFTTENTKLVYEDQFIEFVTALPKDYNLYGLGERIHGFRLNNNLNATFYAADVGDPIDRNLYGSHPYYLETRYFGTGYNGTHNGTFAKEQKNGTESKGSQYESYSHGVYLRNLHGQEVLLRSESLTWRLLGGSIDLFFFDGPTPAEVTKQYQVSAIGLPAMQNYWALGFHQCRWGYRNWTETKEVNPHQSRDCTNTY